MHRTVRTRGALGLPHGQIVTGIDSAAVHRHLPVYVTCRRTSSSELRLTFESRNQFISGELGGLFADEPPQVNRSAGGALMTGSRCTPNAKL